MPNLDLWPLLEELSIRDKGARTIRLTRNTPFAWAQREFVAEVERQYNAGLPVRIIVLKGRQLGISTITEAILFLWAFLHPGSYNLILSLEKGDSQYLYEMTKRYWELGPFSTLYKTKYNTKEGLVLDDPIGSTIRVATANKDEVGRGSTIQGCHGSEVSRWGDQTDTIIPGLGKAIPGEHGTIWVLESTANGVGGFFYDTWQAAMSGESDFIPVFFPWYLHHDYELAGHNLTYADLDDEERRVVEHLLAEGIEPERVLPKLAWRRREISKTPRGIDGFHEEFPLTPDEAFLSTGSNLFTLAELEKCYTRVGESRGYLWMHTGTLEFAESDTGHFTVYKTPDAKARQKYVVALDPSLTLEGDPCCIQVLNRATLEQVAVWHGAATPDVVAEIALAIARWYHTAMLNTEIQGGGWKVLDVWRRAKYRNIWMDRRPDKDRKSTTTIGWNTTHATKSWLIGTLQAAIRKHDIVLHHYPTFYELSQYVCLPTGTYGPARRSGHDDTVMSLGIALVTALSESASLDLAAVMGHGAGDLTGPGQRLTFPGQGTPVTSIPGLSPEPAYAGGSYAIDGEIEDWGTW